MKISHRISSLTIFALLIVLGGPVMAAVSDMPDNHISASLYDQTEPLTVRLTAASDVTAAVLLRQERTCSSIGEGAGVITAYIDSSHETILSPGGATGIIGGGYLGAGEYDGLALIGGGSSGEGHREIAHSERSTG